MSDILALLGLVAFLGSFFLGWPNNFSMLLAACFLMLASIQIILSRIK